MDTGAERSCIATSLYQRHSQLLGGLTPPDTTILGANDQPLSVRGKTLPLSVTWHATTVAQKFYIIDNIGDPHIIIGYDLQNKLDMGIFPKLNMAVPRLSLFNREPTPLSMDCTWTLKPREARCITLPNPYPEGDTLFTPTAKLPSSITSVPSLSNGDKLYVKLMNTSSEPVTIQKGWAIGTAEPAQEAPQAPVDTNGKGPEIPNHLSLAQQGELKSLLHKYKDVFAVSTASSTTPLVKHAIFTTAPPFRQPYRRQNPQLREQEEKILQEMLEEKVIRPSYSPWASPVVLVAKKDKSTRFCVDYRKLNDITIKDAHPLPRIDDTLDTLHGSKWFSTLDLKSGYWQVEIEETDKEKTAFRTSSGQLYEFNVMPFGLCNAPATFSRLMDEALSGLAWRTCLAYLDDVIVFSRTWGEHLSRLEEVFQRMRDCNLKLHPAKCHLGQRKVTFLGHEVSAEGLRPDPTLVKALLDLNPPSTPTQVRQFLGLASYYRRFVPKFSTIASPLNTLLRKDHQFQWNDECQEAFQTLRNKLARFPITAFPNFSLPFRVYTDASNHGLGAILSQTQDGKERIIMSASRTLTNPEKRYSATKKEALGLYWAVHKFRHFLLCQKFEVVTDHYSLQWLQSMKSESATLHRWAAYLQDFDFTIRHQKGKNMQHVDALSRLPRESVDIECAEVAPFLPNSLPQDPPPSHLCNVKVNPIVHLKSERTVRKHLTQIHQFSHGGVKSTLDIFHSRYTGPRARSICEDIVRKCHGCQVAKDYGHAKAEQGHITAPRPWHTIAIDVVGPLRAIRGYKFIISIVDVYSKFSILIPARSHTATDIVHAIHHRVIPYFGVPYCILSDNGPEFTSEVYSQMGKLLGVKLVHSAPYRPQGNSVVERMHRTAKNLLRAKLEQQQIEDWPNTLPSIAMTLNITPHGDQQRSPSEILTGLIMRLPQEDPPARDYMQPQDLIEELKPERGLANVSLKPKARKRPDQNPHNVGDAVLVSTRPHEHTHALSNKWTGPYKVTRVPSQYSIEYQRGEHRALAHVSHTKKYFGNSRAASKNKVLQDITEFFSKTNEAENNPEHSRRSENVLEGNKMAATPPSWSNAATPPPLPPSLSASPPSASSTRTPENFLEGNKMASDAGDSLPLPLSTTSSPTPSTSSTSGLTTSSSPSPTPPSPLPHHPEDNKTSPPGTDASPRGTASPQAPPPPPPPLMSLDLGVGHPQPYITRSGRRSTPPDRLICHRVWSRRSPPTMKIVSIDQVFVFHDQCWKKLYGKPSRMRGILKLSNKHQEHVCCLGVNLPLPSKEAVSNAQIFCEVFAGRRAENLPVNQGIQVVPHAFPHSPNQVVVGSAILTKTNRPPTRADLHTPIVPNSDASTPLPHRGSNSQGGPPDHPRLLETNPQPPVQSDRGRILHGPCEGAAATATVPEAWCRLPPATEGEARVASPQPPPVSDAEASSLQEELDEEDFPQQDVPASPPPSPSIDDLLEEAQTWAKERVSPLKTPPKPIARPSTKDTPSNATHQGGPSTPTPRRPGYTPPTTRGAANGRRATPPRLARPKDADTKRKRRHGAAGAAPKRRRV